MPMSEVSQAVLPATPRCNFSSSDEPSRKGSRSIMKTLSFTSVSSALLRNISVALTIVSLGALAATQPVHAGSTTKPQSIVTNGGFEQGGTGWNATGNAYLGTDSSLANSGDNYAYFTGGQTSTLSQTLQTQAGQNYVFTFYANDTDPNNTLNVLWNGQIIKGSPTTVTSSCPGDYIGYTFTVAATQATTALKFIIDPNATRNDPSIYTDFRIDDITVTPSGAPLATPEPSSVALLVIGTFGLAGLVILRRSKMAV